MGPKHQLGPTHHTVHDCCVPQKHLQLFGGPGLVFVASQLACTQQHPPRTTPPTKRNQTTAVRHGGFPARCASRHWAHAAPSSSNSGDTH